MNLGNVAIYTFLALVVAAACVSLVAALILARIASRHFVGITTFCVVLVFLGWPCSHFQQTLFSYFHRAQNDVVPREYPCIDYKPTFSTLRARYVMTSAEFQAWIDQHQWPLNRTSEIQWIDQQWMGIEFADVAYRTERAPNGKQLRTYHADGITFISYNAF